MNNAKNVNMLLKIKVFALAVVLGMVIAMSSFVPILSLAESEEPVVYYCDDAVYYEDNIYHGEGGQVSDNYIVYCDNYEKSEEYGYPSAPSFGTSELSNPCAPVAGTNIVVFYDRWYANLVPNYTPGMMNTLSNGNIIYSYFPDIGSSTTDNLMSTLYQLMGTTAANGTTSTQFKNGLQNYVSGKGRTVTYESCYQNSTMVNLTKLRQAFDNNKIALIMCSSYNFVYGIMGIDNGVSVTKVNSNKGHMMVVYGYVIYSYYNNGINIRNDTFLYVSSGYQTAEQGYILLNEDLTIQEAYVITIS